MCHSTTVKCPIFCGLNDVGRIGNEVILSQRPNIISFLAKQPNAGHDRLILEVSKSHVITHHNR
jgi:hypothetical protein